MWKDSIRNIVVIFQTTILRIVGFYVRRSAKEYNIRIFLTSLSLRGSSRALEFTFNSIFLSPNREKKYFAFDLEKF